MIGYHVLMNIQNRKANGDSVQDLSMHNFVVMRDKTADPHFLCRKN